MEVMFASVAESQLRSFVSRCKHSIPSTGPPVLEDETMSDVRRRIKRVLDWDGMGEWGSAGRFKHSEITDICSAYMESAQDSLLDITGFQRMCSRLSKTDRTFKRFRERFILEILAHESGILKQFFSGFSLDANGRVGSTEALVQIYFLSKAEPFERLVFALMSFSDLDVEVSQADVVNVTKKYFRLQMEVMRSVMPKMVLRQARGLSSENDANLEGVFVLGTIGAVETALQETEVQLNDRIEALSKRLFASGRNTCTMRTWALSWQEHQELVDTLSAVGMSRLINWVTAVDSQRPLPTT
jgi:hypothetical protein